VDARNVESLQPSCSVQLTLLAYLGLGLVEPIAGIAGVFLRKNAGESLLRSSVDISIAKADTHMDKPG
jgi:hypothetical protein